MKRVYLAGSLNDKINLIHRREILKNKGVLVTSRWLDFNKEYYTEDEVLAIAGWMDYQDIVLADTVIISTFEKSTSGGTHTELGIALAHGKQIIIIGPQLSNCFFHLKQPNITRYELWMDFIANFDTHL